MTTDEVELPTALPPGALTRSIRAQIEREVTAVVPPGKTIAVISSLDNNRAVIGVAVRVGDGFQLAGQVSRDWSGTVDGRVAVSWVR